MKRFFVCSSLVATTLFIAGASFAGGDKDEYISAREDVVFGVSKNAPTPSYNVPGMSKADKMEYYNFKLCKELSIPNVKVDRELNLQPTSASKSLRIKNYLEALEGSPDRLKESVALAPIFIAFKNQNQTLPGFLAQTLDQLSTLIDSEISKEFVCSAIIPSALETNFSYSEASSFYYSLAGFMKANRELDLAEKAVAKSLVYGESPAIYELAHILMLDLGKDERRLEYAIMFADYLYRTQGPEAALESLEPEIKLQPNNDVLRSYISKLLLHVDPSSAAELAPRM